MKKNYEKIYKRLIKEIKRMIREEHDPERHTYNSDSILKEVEKRESRYGISTLNSILEMNDEINGTRCNMVIMHRPEFEKWKEEISK